MLRKAHEKPERIRKCCWHRKNLFALLASISCWGFEVAPTTAALTTILQSGQTASNGNEYTSFSVPAIGPSGHVVFRGVTNGSGPGTIGIYRAIGGVVESIVAHQDPAPDGAGIFGTAISTLPAVNASGEVAFQASGVGFPTHTGIYRAVPGGITEVARSPISGSGPFTNFPSNPTINDAGLLAWRASITGGFHGIFSGSGAATTTHVLGGNLAPNGNGTFINSITNFSDPVLNESGQIVFTAALTGTSGGSNDNSGIFRITGGVVEQIIRENQAAPGGGQYSLLPTEAPAMNNLGQIGFLAHLRSTPSDTTRGIYFFDGTSTHLIARENQPAPSGNGEFASSFSDPVLNNAGQLVFRGQMRFTTGGTTDQETIILADSNSQLELARSGQIVPGGNGKFRSFEINKLAINDGGVVAFMANLNNTTGGNSDDAAIYLTNGIDMVEVIRKGAALGGSTITALEFNQNTSGSRSVNGDDRSGMNRFSQLAIHVTLANGDQAIVQYTPEVQWTGNAVDGQWNSAGNWLLGIMPNEPHQVNISPSVATMLHGPSIDTTIHSLDLGGAGPVVLKLQSNVTLAASEGIRIRSDSTLAGNGFIVGDMLNEGTISPGQSPGAINISGSLMQLSSGTLRLEIAGAGTTLYDHLNVTGTLDLSGIIQIILDGYAPQHGDTFDFLNFGSLIDSGFTLELPVLAGFQWNTNSFRSDGTLIVQAVQPNGAAIPEPASLLTILLSTGMLASRRRCTSGKGQQHNDSLRNG